MRFSRELMARSYNVSRRFMDDCIKESRSFALRALLFAAGIP